MKIKDEVINKLSELSMINIQEQEKEAITVELKELIGKLQVVSHVEIVESKVVKKELDKNGDENRKKKNIRISNINNHVEDNYVVIERMVGEE